MRPAFSGASVPDLPLESELAAAAAAGFDGTALRASITGCPPARGWRRAAS